MPLLDAHIIADALRTNLPDWSGSEERLSRTATLSPEQHAEVQRRVMVSADAMDHHPDITRSGQETKFTLSTHSEGGVTNLDIAMASEIDMVVRQVTGAGPLPMPEQTQSQDAVTEARAEGSEGPSAAGENKPADRGFIGVPAGAQGTPQVPLPDTAPGEPEPGKPVEQNPDI